MNTGTRSVEPSPAVIVLTAASGPNLCWPDTDQPQPTLLRTEATADNWLDMATHLAARASALVTLHTEGGPPAWYSPALDQLHAELHRWHPGPVPRLRTLSAESPSAACLLASQLCRPAAPGLPLDARIDQSQRHPPRTGHWQRRLPGLWQLSWTQGRTHCAGRRQLQRRMQALVTDHCWAVVDASGGVQLGPDNASGRAGPDPVTPRGECSWN
ncbi:hypothetical protein E4656_02530 [Natronospirillum operosum]|uniref:Uncharacterized protein n=1 Tax=Natronospirillum operosum TaxID=2759953 RepID=A0A4Z0WHU9_9GAMM|nr:hypothetical protein [Natronospirillum operosum]TGG95316.1 hypothetical protein E4656_02530 [Natronospirillum operosum]